MNKEIKQGYKQTKVGIIPEDWEVVKLNEKSSIQRGRFSPRPRNDPQFYNGDYPFVQTNDVVNSKGKITTYSQTLNEKGLKVSKLFSQGTILMTIAANIGFTGILTRDMTCPDSLVGIQCKKGLFNEFLNFYFIFNQKRIDYLAEEATQKNINLSTLNSFHIPLPSLKEQEKIAEILTIWDEAITKQEELLRAKELQKKGLMQKLLSGEVRFSGFSDKWKEVRLGEICKITTGSSNREDSSESKGEYTFFDRSQDIRTSDIYLFDGEAIIVAGEGQEFIPKYFVGKFDLHQRTYAIMEFKLNCGKFLFYYLYQNRDYFYSQAVGSTVKSLRLPMFQKMKLKLPSLPEQQKIAKVLSLADDEINLLKNELEELKQQKKALMQKLLTGEVRVKV